MKASELIKELQEYITKYGDLECYKHSESEPTTWDNIGYTRLEEVYNVELSELDEYDKEIYTNNQIPIKTVFRIA